MKKTLCTAILSALLILAVLGSCGRAPAPQSGTGSAPGDPSALTFPEALAREKGEPYASFLTAFDPEDFDLLRYEVQGEASEVYETRDKAVFREMYDALGEIVLTGPYDGPMATDSGEAVFFMKKDGTELVFSLDMGRPSLGNTLYECSGTRSFRAVTDALREA